MTNHEYEELEKVTDKIYRRGYDEGYEKGLNEAWEAAKKIDTDRNLEVYLFGDDMSVFNGYHDMPISEVLAKIKEYEKQKSFGYDVYKNIKETVKSMLDKGYTISMLQTVVEQNFKQEGTE